MPEEIYDLSGKEIENKLKQRVRDLDKYAVEYYEIRLYGLDGADVFDISGKSSESIPVRVIGGPGKDKIFDTSTGDKTLIYETNKKAVIEMGDESVRMSPYDKTLYNYDRTAFAYNTYFLLPYIAYDVDEQFILGLVSSF
jgi:hypothetical protein